LHRLVCLSLTLFLPFFSLSRSITHARTRHQAYHVLTGHGVQPSQILTLSYDDAALSPLNPRPGTLINSPEGDDVRGGVPLDYSGEEVTSETFLAVLLGDSEKVARVAPNGTGRVLASTRKDRVFVFYSDHGAPGLLGMPSGPPLFADQLVGALLNMTRRRDDAEEGEEGEEGGASATSSAGEGADGALLSAHSRHRHRHGKTKKKEKKREERAMLPGNATFSEIVLFVEACEAGSMFEGMLPSSARDDDDGGDGGGGERATGDAFSRSPHRRRFHRDDGEGIFALTAANPHESSWGVYCPGMPRPAGSLPLPEGFDTCLGDLFAVSWMRAAEDPEAEPAESLEELARVVAQATSRNGTFEMGSHVTEYGDRREEEEERAAAFLGEAATGAGAGEGGASPPPLPPFSSPAVPQREADLLHLRLAAGRGSPGAQAAREALGLELRQREAVDGAAAAVAAFLLLGGGGGGSAALPSPSSSTEVSRRLVSRRLADELSELHGIGKEEGVPGAAAAAEAVAALVEAPLLRRRHKTARPLPVVDDWGCLRAGVRAFTESPGCSTPSTSKASPSSQYALRHSRLVARACNAGTGAGEISEMIATACAGAGKVPVA